MSPSSLFQRLAAEAFGTFTLVFLGCGAVAVNDVADGVLTHLGVALVWGLVVTAMIYAVGDVSGAHINPAVTLGFAVAGRFAWKDVPGYWVVQFVAATFAALTLRYLFGVEETKLGTTLPANDVWQTFVMELLLTWFLMVVVLRVSVAGKETGLLAGVAVGAVIAIEAAVGGPISGASMNPARSFGPAVVSGNVASLWVYFAAPALGALLAVPTDRVISQPENDVH